MTLITPARFTMRQLLHILFTEALTFMFFFQINCLKTLLDFAESPPQNASSLYLACPSRQPRARSRKRTANAMDTARTTATLPLTTGHHGKKVEQQPPARTPCGLLHRNGQLLHYGTVLTSRAKMELII